MSHTIYPASPKQVAFLERLCTERGLPFLADAVAAMTAREASAEIDRVMALPRPQGAQAEPGYYVTDGGEYVVVVANKAKTGTYAKRLVIDTSGERSRASWVYAPGVGRALAGMTPLTLEAAAAWGHAHGHCLVCAKALTDPKSVAAGIGPVCARRLR